MSSPATIYTTGLMARRLDQPIHRIEYLIRARSIAALGTAGNAKIYSEQAFEMIASEIRRIDAARLAEAQALRPRAMPTPELVGSAAGSH